MYVALTRAKNCCVLWHSGEAHPAISESHVTYSQTFDDLMAIVRGCG
jgi:ATP-dependent exoDNAse (exonuclease V) beta subunit